MSVAILGSGLIGSFLGTCLASTPATASLQSTRVSFIARPKFIEKVKSANGLTVTMRSNVASVPRSRHADPSTFSVFESLVALKTESGTKGPDFLVVCVKRTSIKSVIDEFRTVGLTAESAAAEGDQWFWSNTTVITMQNGARSAQTLLDAVGESVNIIDGMWPFNVVEPEEGHFHQATVGPIYVCDTPKGRQFMKMLLAAGLDCKVSTEMDNVLYGKLLANLNNAISAISGVPLKQELSQSEYRSILSKCVSEALNVYTAGGINPVNFTVIPSWMIPYVLSLPDFLFTRLASSILAVDEKATSSMYEDLKCKRPTEIAFLQGEISRLGLEYHIPTPVCDRIVNLVREAERKGTGIVPHSGAEIMDYLELL